MAWMEMIREIFLMFLTSRFGMNQDGLIFHYAIWTKAKSQFHLTIYMQEVESTPLNNIKEIKIEFIRYNISPMQLYLKHNGCSAWEKKEEKKNKERELKLITVSS